MITITYEIGGNSIIYINGQHVSTMPAQGAFEATDLFFGHKEETKLFSALFRGFRIYDRALTAEEVLHNFNVDAKTETPDEPTPEEPAVENYLVPQSQWVITGHNTQLNDTTNPMVAAGGVESAALLHQGSIALGEVDLSKYSKVVVMWGCDNSDVTINHYNANANNRIMLLNAEMSMVMSPAEGTIIAGGTYELKGWKVTAFEIDLTGIDYNGPVWLAIDALPGTFALVSSVEFVA